MTKYEEVLKQLSNKQINYNEYGDVVSQHAFVIMDSKYSIEVVDQENEVEVYAYYTKKGDEITYFKHNYKTVSGAVKRIEKLYQELNE